MPKSTRTNSAQSGRVTSTKDAAGSNDVKAAKGSGRVLRPRKDRKVSHPFTDNPSTTLPGTGFKDVETAQRTIHIVQKRSLAYQYQVINTMYNRAKSHAHPTPDIRAAADVFRKWMDETYPVERAALRGNGGFRPLVAKDIVAKLRGEMEKHGLGGEHLRFADFYVSVPRNARLASQVVDEKNPAESDWDIERYRKLCKIVPEGREDQGAWEHEELWDDDKLPTKKHLEMLAWAWTPVPSRTLAAAVKKLE